MQNTEAIQFINKIIGKKKGDGVICTIADILGFNTKSRTKKVEKWLTKNGYSYKWDFDGVNNYILITKQ